MVQYKITNAITNKKTFNSLKELREHITKRNLKPNDLSTTIKVEKVITNIMEIEVEQPNPLTKENGIKLLNVIKNNPGLITVDASCNIFGNRRRTILGETHESNWESYQGLGKVFLDCLIEIGLTPAQYFEDEDHISLSDSVQYLQKGIPNFIQYVIDNYDSLEFNLMFQATDYKPCNGYGITFKGFSRWNQSIHIMLRQKDIMVSSSSLVGRNVYNKGEFYLTNEMVEKLEKNKWTWR